MAQSSLSSLTILCLLHSCWSGHGLESANIYGNIMKYGYYFVDILVGTPRQRVSVIIDTGSSICAFPCAGCKHCGHHADPAFDVARSSTARWVGCQDQCKGACSEGHCSYMQGYSEGSSISGFYFEDEVQLGDNAVREKQNAPVKSQLGCHRLETKLFYDQQANGILGIGPQRGTLLQDLFADKSHVDSSVFSLCLAAWGGQLVVGGHNSSHHTGQMQYIGLETKWGSYGVTLSSISVEGKAVSQKAGRALVDSGTTYTYMASDAYWSLRQALEEQCTVHGCGGARRLASGTCWYVPDGIIGLQRFPKVELTFEGVVVRWVPTGYMFQKGTETTWCYSFEDDGPNAYTTLGASWMMHNEVVFDLQQGRLGVAPAACPEHRERPKLSQAQPVSDFEVDADDLGSTSPHTGWLVLPVGLLSLLPTWLLCRRYLPGAHRRLSGEPEVEAGEVLDHCAPWG